MNILSVFKTKQALPSKEMAEGPSGNLDVFVHPFHRGKLSSVKIEIGRPMFGREDELEFKADLWFKDGESLGIKTLKGDNLQDLVNRINRFLEAL